MNKLDLLKKLKSLANDVRGNENERQSAEEQLNKLMQKYNITEEDLEIEKTERRNFVPDILVINTNNIYLDFYQDGI